MSNNFLIASPSEMVAGLYPLGAVVRRSAVGAVYETEFMQGTETRRAVIKVRPVESPAAERLLEQWRNAVGLAHRNLLSIYAAGSAVVDGAAVVYVVIERGDESLAAVLAERALSEAETRQMLLPALSAMEYLHKNSYAHTAVKPSNIFAVGDQIKLSGDNVARFEEGGDPTEDMRSIGAVIAAALWQAPTRTLENASELFTNIVRHCQEPVREKRWKVHEAIAAFNPPPPVVLQFPIPAPKIATTPEVSEEEPQPRGTPKWIYGALVAIVLVVLVIGLLRKRDPAPVVAASSPAGTLTPGEVAPPPPAEVSSPEVPSPAAAAPSREPLPLQARLKPAPFVKPSASNKPLPVVSAQSARKAEGWSVIVATYASRDGAEKRGRELAQKWRRFTFSVLPQEAEKAYYLVVIGQNLSEDAAEALRRRAVSSGIPRDTYIKRTP